MAALTRGARLRPVVVGPGARAWRVARQVTGVLFVVLACQAAARGAAAQDLDLPSIIEQDGGLAPDDSDSETAPDGDVPDGEPQPQSVPQPSEHKGERIKNKVAEFAGLDKITGRITSIDVYIDETVQFGALQMTPRVCYTSPPSEPPKTDSFVEVDEITLDREIKRIFTGWMFADSPGLNAVEHPVYDVWLKGCKTDSTVPPPRG